MPPPRTVAVEAVKVCTSLVLITALLVVIVTVVLPQLREPSFAGAAVGRVTPSSRGEGTASSNAAGGAAEEEDEDPLSLMVFGRDGDTPPPPPQPTGPPEEHASPSDKWNWFDMDTSAGVEGRYRRPGSNVSRARLAVRRLWQYEVSLATNASRTKWQRKHPQLVFIKGLKVGGTSIAMALDNAARRYNIRLQDDIDDDDARRGMLDPKLVKCHMDRSLYFHHAQYSAWMSKCIPFARFVTLLREPVAQTLSWEGMMINRDYYIDYPDHDCKRTRTNLIPGGLEDQLKHVTHCNDIPFRKNLTAYLIAKRVRHHWPIDDPGEAVTITSRWVSDTFTFDKITSDLLIRKLKSRYFLVGVTERLNEFIVLLALHMGWDPAALVYRKCKATNMDVTRESFTKQFPDLGAKLFNAARPMTEAYEYFRKEFDDRVKQLGPWFKDAVREYEAKLREYQARHANPQGDYKWRMVHYLDGEWEYC